MIIEYNEKYIEEVKDLLVELQEYIASVDKEKYNIITSEYRDRYFDKTIEEIKNVSGIGDAVFEKIKDDITI